MNTDNITEPSRFTVATRRHLGQRARTISYGTAGEGGATVTVDTRTGLRSTAPATDADAPAVSIVFYPWNWDYDSIVSAIISERYPSDRMQAVVNNYLLSPDDPAILAEWHDMQSYRTLAKSIAKEALRTAE